jgi:hypothetical protein
MIAGFIGAVVVFATNAPAWALGVCVAPMVVYALRYW